MPRALPPFRLDPASGCPAYLQVADYLARQIREGVFQPGERMPSQRDLMACTGLSRTTIIHAYLELERRSLVRTRVGSGTFCCPPATPAAPGGPVGWRPRPSERLGRIHQETPKLVPGPHPAQVDFARGKLNATPQDVLALKEIVDELLDRHGPRVLASVEPQGLPALREALAQRARRFGMRIAPREVVVTAGARHALELIAQVLVDPGDAVVVESPGYRGATHVLKAAGARIYYVPVDDQGMDTDVLEDLLVWHRPRLIYTVPTFQNPTGVCLSAERRERLIALSRRYQVPIVEDDPYHELRFEGQPLPLLKAMDTAGLVIHITTFSKTVFPGLRTGWLAAPALLADRLVLAKQVSGQHTSALSQWALAAFLQRGLMEGHVAAMCRILRRRRDAMAEALRREGKGAWQFTPPQGGYCLWAQVPQGWTGEQVVRAAAAAGVDLLPGTEFCATGQGTEHVRLVFATLPEARIIDGIRRLMAAVPATRAPDHTA